MERAKPNPNEEVAVCIFLAFNPKKASYDERTDLAEKAREGIFAAKDAIRNGQPFALRPSGFSAVRTATVQVQRYDVSTVDKRIKIVDVARASSTAGLRSFDAVLRFRLLKQNADNWLSTLVLTVMQSRLVALHVEAIAMGKEADCGDVLKGANEHPQADALAQAQHDVRQRDNMIRALTERVQSLEAENAQLRAESAAKDQTIASLQSEVKDLKSEVKDLKSEVKDLTAQVTELTRQVDILQKLRNI